MDAKPVTRKGQYIPWFDIWSYQISQLLAKLSDPTWRLRPEEREQIEAALEDIRWKATA